MNITYMLYSHNGLYNQFCSFQTLAGLAEYYKDYKIDAVYHRHNKKLQDPQEEHVDLSSIINKVDNSKNPQLTDFIEFNFENINFHQNDFFLQNRLTSNLINCQEKYINCQQDIHDNEPEFSINREPIKIYDGINNIFTITLCWYSKFFYNRTKAIDNAISSVKFKSEYYELAQLISKTLGEYNSAHIRIMKDHFQYYMFDKDRLDNGLSLFENNLPLYVSVDDFNNNLVLSKIKKENQIHNIILNEFLKDFSSLTINNTVALGLISSLVSSMANDFVGTPLSTYTAFIHQERYRNNLPSFKFFPGTEFDKYDEDYLPYSWNSLSSSDYTWQREWKECKPL